MKLAQAERIAQALVGELSDSCERIEIAGSIRRQKADVKDIELVLIPRWGEQAITGQAGLFADNTEEVNLARQRIEEIAEPERLQVIKPGTHEIIPWQLTTYGKYWRLYLPRAALKADVFVCSPETWGLNLVIRTGSGVGPDGRPESGFGPAMLARWKVVSGGRSSESQLRTGTGGIVDTPEEIDVFDACRVRWVEPPLRTSARAVEAYAIPMGVRP